MDQRAIVQHVTKNTSLLMENVIWLWLSIIVKSMTLKTESFAPYVDQDILC